MTRLFTGLIQPFRPSSWPLFIISFLIIVLTVALLYFRTNYPPLMPLWYSRPWGPLRLAPPTTLYIVPILSLCFLVINHYLANLFKQNNLALSKILVWSALVTSLIGLITIHKLLLLI
jgi:hypothetical protein